MLSFNKIKFVIFALCASLCIPTLVFSQEWSAKQKEVWKNVEAHWTCLAQKDLEGFLSYIHQDFSGFSDIRPIPTNKEVLRKWIGAWIQNTQILTYEIEPVTIKIYGDFAIVNYFFNSIEKTADGKGIRASRRYSSTWMKQGDKWVEISAHLENI